MRSNTSLLGRALLWIALRLEILTKIFNYIFSRVFRVLRGFFGVSVKVIQL